MRKSKREQAQKLRGLKYLEWQIKKENWFQEGFQ